MCLLGRAHSSTLQNRTHRQRPRGTLGAQICRPRRVACAIGGRMGRDNQQNTTAPSRRKRRFRGGRSPPRAFLGAAQLRDCTRAWRSRFDLFAKSGGAPSAALFYRRCSAFYERFLALRAAQRNTRRHSAYTAQNTDSSARLRSGCAKNKRGYSRIRATDRKKESKAVTNGQGRQGREDLQDQARPRRRNRAYGRRSARLRRGAPRVK